MIKMIIYDTKQKTTQGKQATSSHRVIAESGNEPVANEGGAVEAEGSQILDAGAQGGGQQHRAQAGLLGSLAPASLQQPYDLGCAPPRHPTTPSGVKPPFLYNNQFHNWIEPPFQCNNQLYNWIKPPFQFNNQLYNWIKPPFLVQQSIVQFDQTPFPVQQPI